MAEAIGKPDFSANNQAAVELEKVPLIGAAHDIIVVKHYLRGVEAVGKRTAEISGIGSTHEPEHRLFEIGLRSQLERCEKVSERVV
jgi:hypothetical protein